MKRERKKVIKEGIKRNGKKSTKNVYIISTILSPALLSNIEEQLDTKDNVFILLYIMMRLTLKLYYIKHTLYLRIIYSIVFNSTFLSS